MQNFINFDENTKEMKELISTSEKIRQANEAEVDAEKKNRSGIRRM